MKTLLGYHAPLQVDTDAGGNWRVDPNGLPGFGDGWEKIGLPTQGVFLSSKQIDMNGLRIDDKSMFFDAASIQTPTYTCSQTGTVPGDNIQIIDAVSTIPLDVKNNVFDPVFFGFGFPGSVLGNHEHVIYGRFQRWSTDVDHAQTFPVMVESNTFGSMEATASDTLYLYRWVYFTAVNLTVGSVGPARVMFGITAKEEPTYEQLMRMRRSFELQQSPDRD
jgi:hypothetical protein